MTIDFEIVVRISSSINAIRHEMEETGFYREGIFSTRECSERELPPKKEFAECHTVQGRDISMKGMCWGRLIEKIRQLKLSQGDFPEQICAKDDKGELCQNGIKLIQTFA